MVVLKQPQQRLPLIGISAGCRRRRACTTATACGFERTYCTQQPYTASAEISRDTLTTTSARHSALIMTPETPGIGPTRPVHRIVYRTSVLGVYYCWPSTIGA